MPLAVKRLRRELTGTAAASVEKAEARMLANYIVHKAPNLWSDNVKKDNNLE